jgi:hypothetical protein
MGKFACLTCAFLGGCALSAQTVPVTQVIKTTGMVGIADAQTAQFNLLNPGVLAPAVGMICTAQVSFVNANDTVLKSATLTIAPGKSASLTLRSDTDLNLVAGDRAEIRAVVTLPGIVPPPTAASTIVTPACTLIPTLEMLDTPSGRTLVVLGRMDTVPQVVATPVTNPN